jgi:hypothetical protein
MSTIYLPSFQTTLNTGANQSTTNSNQPSSSLVFQTALPFINNQNPDPTQYGNGMRNAFKFFIPEDGRIYLQTGNIASADMFNVANATYVSGASNVTNPDSNTTLAQDYLAYIALQELGSADLVAAIENTEQIIQSIMTDPYLYIAMNDAQNTHNSNPIETELNSYEAADSSSLWTVYSHIMENAPERISDAEVGLIEFTSMLRIGDIIQMQVTLNTPPVDASIENDPRFTPIQPVGITYLLNIHIVD